MQNLTDENLVGLPNDELCRRVKVHRGIYSRLEDFEIYEGTLFHICHAQVFNRQLPLCEDSNQRVYFSEDFHHLNGTEAFSELDLLQKFANEQLVDQEGYFFILQIDVQSLLDVEDVDPATGPSSEGRIVLKGPINQNAIQRIYIPLRAECDSRKGEFTDVSPPPVIAVRKKKGGAAAAPTQPES